MSGLGEQDVDIPIIHIRDTIGYALIGWKVNEGLDYKRKLSTSNKQPRIIKYQPLIQ